jgi:small subunit ribosomal protein S16
MLKIKLARIGKKKAAIYRLIISEVARDPYGRILENLGSYNAKSKELQAKAERINYWIGQGAQMTITVNNLLVSHQIVKGEIIRVISKQIAPVVAEAVKKVETKVETVLAPEVAESEVQAEAVTAEEVNQEPEPESEPVEKGDIIPEEINKPEVQAETVAEEAEQEPVSEPELVEETVVVPEEINEPDIQAEAVVTEEEIKQESEPVKE